MSALRMPPYGEAMPRSRVGELACGAYAVEHRARLADADEIGVHALPAEAGVIGCGDDEAATQHLVDTGDGPRQIRQQRRRALLRDARRRMRPGDDVALHPRRRRIGKQHRAGDGDGLAVHSRRAIDDAVGAGVVDRAADLRPHAQDGTGLGGDDLVAADIAERIAGAGLQGNGKQERGDEADGGKPSPHSLACIPRTKEVSPLRRSRRSRSAVRMAVSPSIDVGRSVLTMT